VFALGQWTFWSQRRQLLLVTDPDVAITCFNRCLTVNGHSSVVTGLIAS